MGGVAFCSGEAEQIEWSKIQTPTDEVVVPYDTLASPPEGTITRSDLILVSAVWWLLWVDPIGDFYTLLVNTDGIVCL